MKYAVIAIKGRQYKVSEGDEILVDKIAEADLNPSVLLVVNSDQVSIGKPEVEKAKVKVKILGEEKGEKLSIRKYKAKSRYRRKMGFRPVYTRLQVEKID